MKRGRRARRQLRAAKPIPLVIRWRDGDLTLDARRVYSPAVRSLADAGALASTAYIPGIGPTLDGRNGGGDPYVTDGRAALGILRPVP